MMHKLLVILLLGVLIGLVAWDLSTRGSMPETRVDSRNFMWVNCPSCERMFYMEKTQQEGWCPYDGVQFNFSSGG
jgi:hypothetical protein